MGLRTGDKTSPVSTGENTSPVDSTGDKTSPLTGDKTSPLTGDKTSLRSDQGSDQGSDQTPLPPQGGDSACSFDSSSQRQLLLPGQQLSSTPDAEPASSAASATPANGALPAWLPKRGKYGGHPRHMVLEGITASCQAIGMNVNEPNAEPWLKAWRKFACPDPIEFGEKVARLARWAQESDDPAARGHLRGLNPDGTGWGGADCSDLMPTLCNPEKFEWRMKFVEAWHARGCPTKADDPSELSDMEWFALQEAQREPDPIDEIINGIYRKEAEDAARQLPE